MATPNPPVIFPPFNDATAGLKAQLAEINDYPIAPSERRIALP